MFSVIEHLHKHLVNVFGTTRTYEAISNLKGPLRIDEDKEVRAMYMKVSKKSLSNTRDIGRHM